MSKYLYRNHHWGAPAIIFGKAELGCYGTVRNKNNHNETNKKAAVKLSDHTLIIHLLSTSLASCNLQNGFRFHTLYVTISKFSTPEKDNAHRHLLQLFALILL